MKGEKMIDAVKEKLLAKGMELMQSPTVARMMESEKAGIILEKAMSLPIKFSDGWRTHKEKLTTLLELATQSDVDDLKRAVGRMEDLLRAIKKESGNHIKETDTGDDDKGSVVK